MIQLVADDSGSALVTSGTFPVVNTGAVAVLAGFDPRLASGSIAIPRVGSAFDYRGTATVESSSGDQDGEVRDYLGGALGQQTAEFVFKPNYDGSDAKRRFLFSHSEGLRNGFDGLGLPLIRASD